MQNCLHTREKVPCKFPDRCPLADQAFVHALEIYVCNPCGIQCPTGKIDDGRESQVTSLDVALCFPGTGWADAIAGYFQNNQRWIDIFAMGAVNKTDHRPELCRQLRKAHYRWWVNFSKPGYRWIGWQWRD